MFLLCIFAAPIAAIISYMLLKEFTGKFREVSILTCILSVIFLIKFFVAV